MASKGTAIAIGLGTLAVAGLAIAASSNNAAVKWDDLIKPPLPKPEGFPGEPVTRNRVQAKSGWQYDVLGWAKNEKGEDYFLAVVALRPADYRGSEEWIGYTRGRDEKRKLFKAFAPNDQAYARLSADFGVG